jgi:hypothetical protein
MTNRQRVIDAYNAIGAIRLREEVAYYMDTYSDAEGYEGYDVADAIHDALAHAEANDIKSMARDCINVLIAAGYYRPRVGEVAFSGPDRAPVRGGVRHDPADAWCLWIEK